VNLLEAAILGIVQGLTEFLPVSSSGHLVLAQALLGIRLPGVAFEVTVHVATLCAVLWVYRGRIAELVRGLLAREASAARYVGLLILATLPAIAVGFAARDFLEAVFEKPPVAAGLLLVSGLLAWSLKYSAPRAEAERPRGLQALAIGVAQAVAILPGVSRSGATVATGAWLGVDVLKMAEFSFLMSVPAIAGAAVLQAGSIEAQALGLGTWPLAVGFVAACLSGVLAIRIFVWMLGSGTFHRFAYYCWAVGLGYLAAAALVPTLRV
jgi:undecaprenyl-diphosphatase